MRELRELLLSDLLMFAGFLLTNANAIISQRAK